MDEDSPAGVGSPFAWPLVGHLPGYLFDKLGFLTRCARRFPTATRLRLGESTLLLGMPGDVYHVLVSKHASYGRSPRISSARGQKVLGESLFTMDGGDAHRHRRRLIQPAFQAQRLAPLVEIMLACIDGWLERPLGEVDIVEEMRLLTQRMGGFVLLGVDLQGEAAQLGRALLTRQEFLRHYYLSLVPLAECLPLPIAVRYRQARGVIEQTFARLIRERRSNPGSDILSTLAAAHLAQEPCRLADHELLDELITFGVAIFEPVTDALAWTFYLVARHPEVEARLRLELAEVLGGSPPIGEGAARLPYLEMVLAESMRLYPPTWIFVRIAREFDVLPSGIKVAPGTKIYICPYVLHRDPRYFPEPERFDPERFREPGRHSPAYLPFGAGPRVCIGQRLAKLMMGLVLSRVLQRRRLALVAGQRVRPVPAVTLNPYRGIRMRLEACHSSPAPLAVAPA